MVKPYSQDLRERVIMAVAEGKLSRRELAAEAYRRGAGPHADGGVPASDEGARRQSRPFDALPVFPGREYQLQKTKVAFGPPQDQ